MNTLGLCLNTENFAVTQYSEFDFTSLCVFNGLMLGTKSDGIFEHSGDTDNTTAITSFFKLCSSDFGASKSIRLRRIIIAGYLSGKISVGVYYDEVLKNTYYVNSLHSSGVYQTLTVPINSEDMGEFIGVKVSSEGGSDFSVDRINADVEEVVMNTKSNWVMGRLKQSLPALTLSAKSV
jgi:hypothetical protein